MSASISSTSAGSSSGETPGGAANSTPSRVATPSPANQPESEFDRRGLGFNIGRGAKIAFDVAATLVLLVVASPVFLLLWMIVRLDGGPGTYGHVRVGRHGQPFKCLKFRSMVVNSAEVLDGLLANDPKAAAEWAATRKLSNDPRITPIGRFLRKTSLDELPQLVNVLRQDMSLVGPRPVVESELEYYGGNGRYYRAVRPGITGLWQVSGRSDTSYAQRVQLDTEYVRTWSFFKDIAILLKTLPAVLMQKGAR